ncbi:MAG TPA: terminase family protein [Dissulfurispiraceae bacterium]|nr:terminase family protein [Dissulfurispiraceae bacterium]
MSPPKPKVGELPLDGPGFLLARKFVRDKLISEPSGYIAHPGQQRIHRAYDTGARYVYAVCGGRSGKTRCFSQEIMAEAAFEPDTNATQRLITIAAPEQDLTDKVFAWCWQGLVLDRLLGYEPKRKSDVQRIIEMPWGARIEGKTTKEPQSLLGEGVAFIVIDEDARVKETVYPQYIERNLMDFRGRVGRITTPLGKGNHAYRDYMDWSTQAINNPEYATVHFTSYDNPNLPPGEVAKWEDSLRRTGNGLLADQEIHAKFVAYQGSVYTDFDLDFHTGLFEPNPDMPVWIGVDWGFTAPAAITLWQIHEGDIPYCFDEIYVTQHVATALARLVLERLAGYGLDKSKIILAFADPENPGSIEEWIYSGIPTVANTGPKARVADGIGKVRELFARKDRPGIYFHRTRCAHTISDLQGYHYPENGSEDKPAKEHDHGCDSVRYFAIGALGPVSLNPLIELDEHAA